jgi:hypothetical protein
MNEMKAIQVGVMGLGTVGGGVFEVLRRNQEEIRRRAGRGIEVTMVSRRDVAKARSLVDDAAQALGARYRERPAGNFGDVGLFSFDKGKNITTLQGGVLVADTGRVGDELDAVMNGLRDVRPTGIPATLAKLPVFWALEGKRVVVAGGSDGAAWKAELLAACQGLLAEEVAHGYDGGALDEARAVIADLGLPAVIRPAYILGGRGTGIAFTPEQFEKIAANGLTASPISEILIEESVYGWKEFELEVMRDRNDNAVIV